mgnify:CR=1 FL=1
MDVNELRGLIGLPIRTDIVTPIAINEAPVGEPDAFQDHKHLTCSISDHDAEILAKFEGKGVRKDKYKVLQQDKMMFSSMDDFIKKELFAEYL